MKINVARFPNTDMLGEYLIPQAPSLVRKEAENIIRVLLAEQIDYTSVTNFDKKLVLAYWRHIDGMDSINMDDDAAFCDWFVNKATMPDAITRARRWLRENNYLIPKPKIDKYAQQAADRWRGGMKV